MDGNLRWSKKHKITAQKGYIQGLNKINEIIDICLERKIKYLTLYALSTENNKRTSVKIIYKIINNNLNQFLEKVTNNKKIKIKIIGERKNLPKEIGSLLSILLKQDAVSDSVSNNNENADNDTSFTKTA